MTRPCEVSVVIPTRNRALLLREALKSALDQVDVGLEVIVADDGSTDETPEVTAHVGDPRVRAVRTDRPQGMSATRNAAVSAARGEWVAFLDDDDLWAPTKLRRQLDAARVSGARWVFCDVFLVSPDSDVVRLFVSGDTTTMLHQLLAANVVQAGNSTVVVRRDLLQDIGGYDEDFNSPWDLWIRLAAAGAPAVVGEPLVAYRRHPGTFIAHNRTIALDEARRLAAKHEHLSRAHGVAFDFDRLDRWLQAEHVRALRRAAFDELKAGRRFPAIRLQAGVVRRTRASADVRRLLRIVLGERARGAFRHLAPLERGQEPREPVPGWLAPYLSPSGGVAPRP